MARKRPPLDDVVMTRSKLEMYVQYGDAALKGQSPQEFAAEVLAAYKHLMDVRNIVLAVSRLDQAPSDAARFCIE